ncbi:hypothetical protein GIB67_030320 [Kingdonia uniflora]|uniref:Response regulatory domain-containing protein n=1 Tax=Kingdonia uniflora TaxID=39325 RepID=A0A7J7M6L2_9MAGN|nr:hypothetical protein GIB67_030320 [Kingdonia uniflora]
MTSSLLRYVKLLSNHDRYSNDVRELVQGIIEEETRVLAAVVTIADGFKAWETLKGRPYDIDLVLTELDLPSISGFNLLTNIMEHSICKNIPTIILSSYDSMNVVLKCTSRDVADFLVKPLRKNELKNLWQHVWRKNSLNDGVKDLTDKRKLEAVNEDNFSFKHSNDCVEYINENKECSEKGSDAQSSCTKPDIEIESICIQDLQELSHPKFRSASLINGVKALKYGRCKIKLDEKLLMDEKLLKVVFFYFLILMSADLD